MVTSCCLNSSYHRSDTCVVKKIKGWPRDWRSFTTITFLLFFWLTYNFIQLIVSEYCVENCIQHLTSLCYVLRYGGIVEYYTKQKICALFNLGSTTCYCNSASHDWEFNCFSGYTSYNLQIRPYDFHDQIITHFLAFSMLRVPVPALYHLMKELHTFSRGPYR